MSTVMFVVGSGERAGAEQVLLTLARGLSVFGYQPVVCCLADGPFVDQLVAERIPIIRGVAIPRVRELWRFPEAVSSIAAAAREAEATVIQGNGERVCVYAGWAARRARCRSVHWLHDAPLRDAASAAVQLAMATSPHDAVVSPAAWMAEEFHRRLRVRVRHIPNGVELDRLPADAADVCELFGWPAGSPVVGYFGRLQHWKGCDSFLRAAARVGQIAPTARFLIVGGALYGWERDYADSLPRLARDLGIADRVHFAGHRDDALALMAGCDLIAHCSRKPEPFPTVVIEAMALGRTVVATRSRGPEEMILDGVDGRLVAPSDDAAMAAVFEQLLRDPGQRQRLGVTAASKVRATLSADAMRSRYAELYAEIGAPPNTAGDAG